MLKKTLQKIFVVLLVFNLTSVISYAQPTEQDILDRIESGLDWLVPQQNGDGSWIDMPAERIASTGFVLTKLCDYAFEHGTTPFDPSYEYYDEVVAGYNFIFNTVRVVGPGMCATPIALGYSNHHEIYNAAVALMALGAAKNPTEVVPVGVAAGMTYLELQDEMVKYFEWAQDDLLGGWRYQPNAGSDNSHTGWVVLALRYAETNGSAIPTGIKSKLDAYIDYIQCDSNGGSGYASPCSWINLLKTGNLLLEMAFVGDPITSLRAQAALNYIQNNWNNSSDPGYGDTQAMYCLLKGFESYGIEQITVGGSPISWFDDFTTLLFTWSASGGWPSTTSRWTGELLSTGWALMVLEKVAPPPVCPDDIVQNNDPGECGAIVEFDISAHYEATITQVSGLPSGSLFPVGITEQRFEIERNGDITLCEFTAEIVDIEPPEIACMDITAELDEFGQVTVSPEDIDGGTTDNCSFEFVSDPVDFNCADLGVQIVTLTAVDPSGNEASCDATVTVVDLIPPTISAVSEPFMLKQNNHKYVSFSMEDFEVVVEDNCGVASLVISRVTSDEAEDIIDPLDDPDGETLNDMVISNDCQSIMLRKERAGNGNGRVYTIELLVTDESDNSSTTNVLVYVPHHTGAVVVDDGPVYEVFGDCNMMEMAEAESKSAFIPKGSEEIVGYELKNYPNPFNNATTIQFKIPVDTHVLLKVYNIFGQEVKTLVNQKFLSGTYNVHFQSEKLPVGQYIYRLNTSEITLTKKMLLNK